VAYFPACPISTGFCINPLRSLSTLPWRKTLYFIGLTLGLTLFARQLWIGYGSLENHHYTLPQPGYLLGALGCYLAGYLVQIWAWVLIMRYLDAPLTASQAMQGYLLAFLPRYIPGGVWGYLSRNEWLAQHCGIRYATSSVGSVLEVTTLLLSAFSFVAVYWVAAAWRVPVAGVCGLLLWLNWWVVPQFARYFRKSQWNVQINRQQFIRLCVLGNVVYFIFWGFQGAAILLVGTALGTVDQIRLSTGIFSASLAWAIGFLILFVPAGLGIRETTLATLLSRFANVQPGLAGNIAIISRLAIICAEIILVFATLPGHFYRWWSKDR
jgi:hypothetical protein